MENAVSNVLDLIAPVGVTMNEQNLANFPASANAGFAIDKDHEIHGFGD